jgi:hypothetical protein
LLSVVASSNAQFASFQPFLRLFYSDSRRLCNFRKDTVNSNW